MSDFNKEYFNMQKYFFGVEDIRILLISESINKSYDVSENDDVNLGFVNTIKVALAKQTNELTYTLMKLDKESKDVIGIFRGELNLVKDDLDSKVNKVLMKLDDMISGDTDNQPESKPIGKSSEDVEGIISKRTNAVKKELEAIIDRKVGNLSSEIGELKQLLLNIQDQEQVEESEEQIGQISSSPKKKKTKKWETIKK